MNCFKLKRLCLASVIAATFSHAGDFVVASEKWEYSMTGAKLAYYCRANPDECEQGGKDEVPLTIAELVNWDVNRSYAYASDDDQYGRGADKWIRLSAAPSKMGDCEDFALEKRYRLLKMGYSNKAVRIAASPTHAVVIVRTPEGDVVLDSFHRPGSVVTVANSMWRDDLTYIEVGGTMHKIAHILHNGKVSWSR